MKFQVVLVGALFFVAAQSAGKAGQDNRTNRFIQAAQQTLTGCVDEQFGRYILLDNQMVRFASLQSAGVEKDVFAKYVGHKVRVRGTKSAGPSARFIVAGITEIADSCGSAK
jgi:hypothetical protein